MDEWDKKFGPMYGYFVGVSPRLVVKDLELVKQVCARDDCKFTYA
jgi:hypothetical protein